MNLSGKNILVIGAGLSGVAAAKVAAGLGAKVTLSDAKDEGQFAEDFSPLRAMGINTKFGKQEENLLDGVDMLMLSPVVPVKVPIAQAAIKRGIKVTNEVELAYALAKSPIAAITGTNGKTTTVTLAGLLLQTKFNKVGVGGNIGIPLSEEVLRVGEKGATVAEISSYQMEVAADFHPKVAAVLNVTPDHIKRHGSMEVYQAMKEKIFMNQTAEDFLVLNYDDELTRGMKDRAKSQVCYFSGKEELAEGAFIQDGLLVLKWGGKTYELVSVKELGIKGAHNVLNALAAAAVAFFMGAEPAKMTKVLKDFKGVEHRIEFTALVDGVPYYNDSKATNTDSAIKALETFDGHIILLAGGDDKGTDLTDFMALVKKKTDALILMGDAAARFKENALKAGIAAENIIEAGYSMDKAVQEAKKLAHSGQIVLLSPACASFDMYNGFEERGRDFKRAVGELAR